MCADKNQKIPQILVFRFFLVFWLMLGFVHAPAASPPILTNASWSAGQFQFTLQAETNVSYLVEASTDLRTWSPVLTNTERFTVRTITVSTAADRAFWRARAPLFLNAITASGTITLTGSGWIDSFDSGNVSYSTNGQYDPVRRKAGGDIVTASRASNALSVGNMKIAGVVGTGPGGTVTLGPNGGVGSLAFLSNPANAGLIEPGYSRDDVNFSLGDRTLPNSFNLAAPPPAARIVNGTNYVYVLNSGDYRINTPINLGSSQAILVTGKVRLYTTAVVVFGGNSFMLIGTNGANSNASIEWYAGSNVSLGGNGIINGTGLANNLSICGLNTCVSVTYAGNSPYVGTINASRALVSISGNSDAVGSIIGNTFSLSGNMGFHFDEAFKRAGPF
jgi:hypothetical protein